MRVSLKTFLVCGLLVAVGLVVFVVPFASSDPDGLHRVAADRGFADDERPHALEGAPLSNYEVEVVESPDLSTAVAGVIGVLLTFAFGVAFFKLLRRRSSLVSQSEGNGN